MDFITLTGNLVLFVRKNNLGLCNSDSNLKPVSAPAGTVSPVHRAANQRTAHKAASVKCRTIVPRVVRGLQFVTQGCTVKMRD